MDHGDSDGESSDNDGDVDSSEVSSSDSDTPSEREPMPRSKNLSQAQENIVARPGIQQRTSLLGRKCMILSRGQVQNVTSTVKFVAKMCP